MNARANTRNVALIRNVLLDELIEEYSQTWSESESPETLHEVLLSKTYQQRAAGRLGISMPDPRLIVGRVVSAAYNRSVRARKSA